jgi:cytochrome c biogenesis protein CcdA/thiol-disulfide isomerase/thioredoxin
MNYLDFGLAFVEGLALVASPCILPILPILLSSSTESGKGRPFGIITGFVLSFTVFALLSRKLVTTLGLDVELIRGVSLFLLLALGLILISSKLTELFGEATQKLSTFGSKLSFQQNNENQGFLSGLIIGSLIGLIWTPCAGPILAAVIVQTIRQDSDLSSFITVFSFALGVGIPMLFIALLGRQAFDKLTFFKQNSLVIRRVFGWLIIAAVLYTAFGSKLSLPALDNGQKEEKATLSSTTLVNKLKNPYKAPPIEGITHWINSEPLSLDDLKGKVVLIDFWTYSCVNCIRTLPHVTSWNKEYKDKGLVIIGIQAPEFEFEKKLENVQKAVRDRGIKYPVALDNNFKTWTNYHNRFWPAHYLINKDGLVVYENFGEGHYQETENNIRVLLGLTTQKENKITKPSMSSSDETPETYLGYERMKNFANARKTSHDVITKYSFLEALPLHFWGLNGLWKIEKDKIVAVDKATLKIHFKAQKVYAVLGSTDGKPREVTLKLNGKSLKNLKVNKQTLYELIDQEKPLEGNLELETEQTGLEVYTFTFGE